MTDPNFLLDCLVATLQSCTDLVAAVGGTPENISAYRWQSGGGMNLDMAIQQQPAPSLLCCWVQTRTGNFQNRESIKHDFQIYLAATDDITVATLFTKIREGQCMVPYASKFKLLQIDPSVHPPDGIACQPATRLVATNFAAYDYPYISFTLIERGFDG